MRVPAIGCVLALLLWPALTGAQSRDPAAAEALFREGRRDMERRDPAAACKKFAESQRLDPAPGTLLNLAECEEAQGRLASAWTQLRAALDQFPARDPRRPLAQRRVQALEPRVPKLTVRLPSDAPAGARVRRDEVELGPASLAIALPVDPGKHLVVLEAPGRASGRLEVTLQEGQHLDVVALPGAPVPLVATPAVVAPQAAVDRRASAPPAPPAEGTSSRRIALYATGGLASATTIGVVVTGVLWLGKRGTASDECPG